ncbi:D-alanyl-D-alanine carboxypeptidase family protein [Cellulomonas sp. NPDC055163]
MTLSVSAYAFTVPSMADVTAQRQATEQAQEAQAQLVASAEATEAALTERRAAVVQVADSVAARAQVARETANAAALTPEVVAPLDEAVAELGELLEIARAESAADPARAPEPAATGPAAPLAASAPSPTEGAAEPAPAPLPSDAPAATPTPTPSGTASAVPERSIVTTEVPARVAGVDVPQGPEDATTARLREAVEKVAQASAQVELVAEANSAAVEVAAGVQAAAAAESERAAAEAARVAAEQAATRAAWRTSLEKYGNGQVPESALCALDFDTAHELRCDAAEQLELLDAAYVDAFGVHISISDSYRSLAGQYACTRTKGSLCAAPGTSNHGLGTAVDLGGGIQTFGTRQHRWLVANADEFGWTLPEWARATGSKPEAWHWEYVG